MQALVLIVVSTETLMPSVLLQALDVLRGARPSLSIGLCFLRRMLHAGGSILRRTRGGGGGPFSSVLLASHKVAVKKHRCCFDARPRSTPLPRRGQRPRVLLDRCI
jgi:hypothetical protein